jgi:SlyX protein
MKTLEERLIDLESRLTFQEDLIDTLNTTVFRQQQQIDELELLCTRLAQLLPSGGSGSIAAGDR